MYAPHALKGQKLYNYGTIIIKNLHPFDFPHQNHEPKIRENDLERLSKDVTISQIMEEIKRNSSRWIKNLDPAYYHFFAWQGGYAAYSISQSVVDKTLQYIANQKEHHTKHSFAEEYRAFLQLYNVEYDENFVFRD